MVSLVYENNIICVSVVDNGNGISNKNSDMINGNGIENMKKRAEEIGGKFEIISEKDIGVKISITLKI